jgi:hypothetical protein
LIKFIQHQEIDQKKWDLCIEQSHFSLVYAYSWYLNCVSPNWHALVLNDYDAVMPLTHHKKWGFAYLYQPFFTQQLGVFSKSVPDAELLQAFIQAIPAHFRFTAIQLNESNGAIALHYPVKKAKNYLLGLNKPYSKIYKAYGSQAKRNIKKAQKMGLGIEGISAEQAIAFYQSNKGHVTKGVQSKHYKLLAHLFTELNMQNKLLVKGVFEANGAMVASAAFVLNKGRIVFILGNTSHKGREMGAMHYLFDHVIMQFAEHQMLLDFEGSEIPGIARFFKSFGSGKTHYFRLKINKLPWLLRWLK